MNPLNLKFLISSGNTSVSSSFVNFSIVHVPIAYYALKRLDYTLFVLSGGNDAQIGRDCWTEALSVLSQDPSSA